MKRFCFLFTFIISYLFASSFGTWTIYHTDKGVSEYYVSNWTDTDTVINGLTYHEVFLKNFKIRFDGDKVYQYLCDEQEEILTIASQEIVVESGGSSGEDMLQARVNTNGCFYLFYHSELSFSSKPYKIRILYINIYKCQEHLAFKLHKIKLWFL